MRSCWHPSRCKARPSSACCFSSSRPTPRPGFIIATVAYVITRSLNLYIGERARVATTDRLYSIQQIFGPSVGFIVGLVLIKLVRPVAGMAAGRVTPSRS